MGPSDAIAGIALVASGLAGWDAAPLSSDPVHEESASLLSRSPTQLAPSHS
jgi:hypothetical protein